MSGDLTGLCLYIVSCRGLEQLGGVLRGFPGRTQLGLQLASVVIHMYKR